MFIIQEKYYRDKKGLEREGGKKCLPELFSTIKGINKGEQFCDNNINV